MLGFLQVISKVAKGEREFRGVGGTKEFFFWRNLDIFKREPRTGRHVHLKKKGNFLHQRKAPTLWSV